MTDQEARIAKLECELAALKKAAEPPKPFVPVPFERLDLTANAMMSPATLHEMARAVGDNLMRDLVSDGSRRVGLPSAPSGAAAAKGTGWAEPRELAPPPGQELIDGLCDEQDRRDKVELARRLAGGGGE